MLLFVLLTLATSCDPKGDNRLWMHNTSNDTLYYFKSYNEDLPIKNPFQKYDYVLPKDSVNIKLGSGNLKNAILYASKDSSLTIYTLKKEILDSKEWKQIVDNKLLTKHKFSISEIETFDWHLNVPR